MKAQLETIHLSGAGRSYHYFRLSQKTFLSYWHYHPALELTYIEKGRGIRVVGDHIDSFREGDLVLLGKNIPHNWTSTASPSDGQSRAYVFQFEKTALGQVPEWVGLYPLFERAQKGIYFPSPSEELLVRIKNQPDDSSLAGLINFLQILELLSQDKQFSILSSIAFTQSPLEDRHRQRTSAVQQYLMDHLEESISLGRMAQAFHLSPPAFSRWFREAFGQTFVGYVNALRIERICQQLLAEDVPIAEIAFRNGFESLSHFNRLFKKIKRQSPREYRKKQFSEPSNDPKPGESYINEF